MVDGAAVQWKVRPMGDAARRCVPTVPPTGLWQSPHFPRFLFPLRPAVQNNAPPDPWLFLLVNPSTMGLPGHYRAPRCFPFTISPQLRQRLLVQADSEDISSSQSLGIGLTIFPTMPRR